MAVTITEPLFPSRWRDDPSTERAEEWTYRFLDRINDPAFAKVRTVLGDWFECFARHQDADAVRDLRGRLRAKQPLQFESAFWELYLHELHLRLGYEIEVHPSGPKSTRPDFLLTRGSERFYLEAIVPVPSEGRLDLPPGAATVIECLEAAYHPDFFLQLRFITGGGSVPKRKAVVAEVEHWLQRLNWQQSHDGPADQRSLPEAEVKVGEWLLGLRAHPRSPADRGNRTAPTVRIFPVMAAWPDKVMAAVAPTLDEKTRKYGELDSPYIVAAWIMSPFAHEEGLTTTLFGTRLPLQSGRHGLQPGATHMRQGLWTPDRSRREQPSGVLLAGSFDFNYNAVARQLPRLFHNPWAAQPLRVELPFPATRVSMDEREVTNTDATMSGSELFGLEAGWPGRPFAAL